MTAAARRKVRGSVAIMANRSAARVAETAACAERLGYCRIWVADEGIVTRDVFVCLAAVAAATSEAKIGPGITSPFTRHPAVTAGAVAALDEMSGGRAFLGLGAGGGMALGPLAVKRRRPVRAAREMISAVRGLWAGETVSLAGETVTLRRARLVNPRPGIEVHLAGRGPMMVRLAGAAADGFYASYVHKAVLGALVEQLRERGRPLTLTYCTRFVLDDAGWEAARRDMSFRLPDSPPEVHRLIGITQGELSELRAALRRGGPDAAAGLVRDEWVAPFVIAGSAAECRAELGSLVDAYGIDEVLVAVDDLDAAPARLEAAAAIIGFQASASKRVESV